MSQDTFRKAMATVDVNPGFPSDLKPYMQEQAEILLREKKIAAIPDWARRCARTSWRRRGRGRKPSQRHRPALVPGDPVDLQ